jgi:hypothetical protein
MFLITLLIGGLGLAPSGVQGQSPWSGGRGALPPEALGSFLFEAAGKC